MTDPLAPRGYRFDKEKKLAKVLEALRENAETLEELSFGDAASEVNQAVARIEHHTKEDFWTRLSRSAANYIARHGKTLQLPHVSVHHAGRGEKESLSVQLNIMLDTTVQEFIDAYDTKRDA
jgi:hypothetical protein